MATDLTTQLRTYAQQLDEATPQVESLVPPVRVISPPMGRMPRRLAWKAAVAAAIVVLMVVGGVILVPYLLDRESAPVITEVPTPTTLPVPTTAPVSPTTAASPTSISEATTTTSGAVPAPASVPLPRALHDMVYAAAADRVVLFGGFQDLRFSPAPLADTWLYDLATDEWLRVDTPDSPPTRGGHMLAYDQESARVVLFGGDRGSLDVLPSGTWVFDPITAAWTEMAPSAAPPGRTSPAMAYDAESDRVILFGGDDGSAFRNDTWAYDVNSDSWTEMSPPVSPPARWRHAMTYDAESDRILMWGGLIAGAAELGDGARSVWAYDFNTNTWTELAPAEGPLPRSVARSSWVYDAASDRAILVGGDFDDPEGQIRGVLSPSNEVWAYDFNTNTWEALGPIALGPTMLHAVALDPTTRNLVVFGGVHTFGDFEVSSTTWVGDLATGQWRATTP